MARKHIKKGEVIFREGNFSDCAYIIESGAVEILEINAGEDEVIGLLKENDIFGEIGLIDGLPRSAMARAAEDSIVHVLSKETFENLSKHNPEALMPILKVLAHRLRETLSLVKNGSKIPQITPRANASQKTQTNPAVKEHAKTSY